MELGQKGLLLAMLKKLLLTFLLLTIPLTAFCAYRQNPYTGKLDFYLGGSSSENGTFGNLTVNDTISTPGAVNLNIANSTGASKVLVNMTSGNVGINTITPTQFLDVKGNIALGNSLNDGYGRIFINQKTPRAYPTTLLVGADDGSSNYVSFGGGTALGYATKQLYFYTGATENTTSGTVRLGIDSAGLVSVSTNLSVGKYLVVNSGGTPVGTSNQLEVSNATNPMIKTIVAGNPALGANIGQLSFGVADKNSGAIRSVSESDWSTTARAGLAFDTMSGSAVVPNVLYLNATGMIGIGNITPVTKLDVRSANKAFSQNHHGNLFVGTTDAYGIDKGGSIALGGLYHTSDGVPLDFARINGRKETATIEGLNGYFTVDVSSDNSPYAFERMRINSAGNTGFGTSSPLAKLHAQIGADITTCVVLGGGYLGADVPWIGFNMYTKDVYGANISTVNNLWDGGWIKFAPSNTDAGTNYAFGFIDQATNASSTIMTIRKDGRVGLGITSPTTTFDMNGSFRVINDTAVTTFFCNNTTGNVGIGTTAPGSKLHVTGNIELSNSGFIGTTQTIFRHMFGSDATGHGQTIIRSIDNDATDGIQFQNFTASPIMSILNSGNVGIGTTAPGQQLSVISNSIETSNAIEIGGYSSSVLRGWTILRKGYNTPKNKYDLDISPITGSPGGDLTFLTNGIAGNVGIGNTTPAYKLDVNGTGNFVGNCSYGQKILIKSPDNTLWACQPANTTGVFTCSAP